MSEQHPALNGDEETEIAKRSADGAEGRHWLRELVYRIPRGHRFDPDAMDHTANLAGAAQAAIQNGLHPKGEPFFAGARPHDTVSDNYVLTYAVPVVPAVVDHEAQTTVTPTQITVAGQQGWLNQTPLTSNPVPAIEAETVVTDTATVQPNPGTSTASAPPEDTP